MSAAGGFTHFYQLAAGLFIACHQRTVRKHHVDFVSARRHGFAGFTGSAHDIVAAVGEVGDRGDLDLALQLVGAERAGSGDDELRINAHRRRVAERRLHLLAQRFDHAVGVAVVQAGQIHQRQRLASGLGELGLSELGEGSRVHEILANR